MTACSGGLSDQGPEQAERTHEGRILRSWQYAPEGSSSVVGTPAVEPTLRVNGDNLVTLYSDWRPMSGEPVLGEVHAIEMARVAKVSLHDNSNTPRIMTIWFYEERPDTPGAERIAELDCPDARIGDAAPSSQSDVTDVAVRAWADSGEDESALVSLASWKYDHQGAYATIDFKNLMNRVVSTVYAVVAVIWYPGPDDHASGGSFKTASWVFSMQL